MNTILSDDMVIKAGHIKFTMLNVWVFIQLTSDNYLLIQYLTSRSIWNISNWFVIWIYWPHNSYSTSFTFFKNVKSIKTEKKMLVPPPAFFNDQEGISVFYRKKLTSEKNTTVKKINKKWIKRQHLVLVCATHTIYKTISFINFAITFR